MFDGKLINPVGIMKIGSIKSIENINLGTNDFYVIGKFPQEFDVILRLDFLLKSRFSSKRTGTGIEVHLLQISCKILLESNVASTGKIAAVQKEVLLCKFDKHWEEKYKWKDIPVPKRIK